MKINFTLLLLIVCLPFMKGQDSSYSDLILIGNNTSYQFMETRTIIEVFKGRTQYWPNKEKITLVLPTSKSKLAPLVANEIFKSSAGEMQKYWLSLVFQGRGNPPVFLHSSEEIYRYVSLNPGSIGLVEETFKIEDNKLIIKSKR